MNKFETYPLSQTYIRFKFTANENFKHALEKFLLEKGKKYAELFYHKDLVIDEFFFTVDTEDGSLKSWLTIWGKVTVGALAAYGGLRAGIDYVVDDSRNISQQIFVDIANQPNIDPLQISRVERRLGVPGQLKKMNDEIDYLDANRENLTEQQQREIINKIQKRFRKLVTVLDTPTLNIVQHRLEEFRIPIDLPQIPANDRDYYLEQNTEAIRIEEARLIEEENIDDNPQILPPPN